MMEIVIKIPEEKYQTIINHTEEILDESSFIEPKYLYRAVLDGTPLPKGHGIFYDVGSLDKTVAELNSKRVHEITRGQCKLIKEVIMHLPILVGEDNGGGEDGK